MKHQEPDPSPEFEILPPGRPAGEEPLFRLIALVMDNLFRVPGTQIRFGMDPLIGLLPGIGDGLGAVVGLSLIVLGARYGLPKIVLIRMTFNVLLNTVIGAIPFVGDAFSLWFKSNALNHALFTKHAGKRRKATWGDWAFVGGLLLGSLALVAIVLYIVFKTLSTVFGLL